jgi:hypothetical protein
VEKRELQICLSVIIDPNTTWHQLHNQILVASFLLNSLLAAGLSGGSVGTAG